MHIPETYEEFLKTPKEQIDNIINSSISLQEAQILMKYFDQFDEEYKNKTIHESIKLNVKHSNATFGEDLNE